MVFAAAAVTGCQSAGKGPAGRFIAEYPPTADSHQTADCSGAINAAVENANRQIAALNTRLLEAQDKLALRTGDMYEVKKGDSLCKISGRTDVYKNKYLWTRIWSANRDIVKDPNIIYPGQMLIVRDRRAE